MPSHAVIVNNFKWKTLIVFQNPRLLCVPEHWNLNPELRPSSELGVILNDSRDLFQPKLLKNSMNWTIAPTQESGKKSKLSYHTQNYTSKYIKLGNN